MQRSEGRWVWSIGARGSFCMHVVESQQLHRMQADDGKIGMGKSGNERSALRADWGHVVPAQIAASG
jgi:hypothetical protein